MNSPVLAGLLATVGLIVLGCSGDSEGEPTTVAGSVTPAASASPSPVTASGRASPAATAATPTVQGSPAMTTPLPGMPPAWPFVFSGAAEAGGQPVPPGYQVVGRIDDYESDPVDIKESGGRFLALTVGPLKERWFGRPITFHLIGPDGSEVQAEQSLEFIQRQRPTVFSSYQVKFPSLP